MSQELLQYFCFRWLIIFAPKISIIFWKIRNKAQNQQYNSSQKFPKKSLQSTFPPIPPTAPYTLQIWRKNFPIYRKTPKLKKKKIFSTITHLSCSTLFCQHRVFFFWTHSNFTQVKGRRWSLTSCPKSGVQRCRHDPTHTHTEKETTCECEKLQKFK